MIVISEIFFDPNAKEAGPASNYQDPKFHNTKSDNEDLRMQDRNVCKRKFPIIKDNNNNNKSGNDHLIEPMNIVIE